MKRKTSTCIVCNQDRFVYAKRMCQRCYWTSKPKKALPIYTKPIPKESKKRKKERPIYSKLAKQHKLDNPYCQAKLEGCTHIVTETHHMKGRGKHYLDTSTFLSVCKNCHDIITEDSALAIKLGLSFLRTTSN